MKQPINRRLATLIAVCSILVFIAIHAPFVDSQQRTQQTIKYIYNDVWNRTDHTLMAVPNAGAQGVSQSETYILNDVWDKTNHMLRVTTSGTGAGGLPSDPAPCPGGSYVNDIDINGTLTCSIVSFAQLANVPLLNTLPTGLTPNKCVQTDATGKFVSATDACGTGGGGGSPPVGPVGTLQTSSGTSAFAAFGGSTPCGPDQAVTAISPTGATICTPIAAAPLTARYLTTQSEPGLTNEVSLGALTDGVLVTTQTGGIATLSSVFKPSGVLVGTTQAQRLTATGVDARECPAQNTDVTLTPNLNACDLISVSDMQQNVTIANPIGAAAPGQLMRFQLCSSSVRTLTWGSLWSDELGLALPAATLAGKCTMLIYQYNSASSHMVLTHNVDLFNRFCPSGVLPPGSYTNSNVTIDARGCPSAISNGTGGGAGGTPAGSLGDVQINGGGGNFAADPGRFVYSTGSHTLFDQQTISGLGVGVVNLADARGRRGVLFPTSLSQNRAWSLPDSDGTLCTTGTCGGGGVSPTRLINTAAPITGGGDLSADRTLTCPTCTTNASALAANLPVIGAGGQATTTGTRSGNTTAFVTKDASTPGANECAKWDASGNLTTAGAACGTATGAPSDAHYLTNQAEPGLSAEVNLGLLTTGLLKISVSTGVATPSTATAGTDYQAPLTNSAGLAGALSDETGSAGGGLAVFNQSPTIVTPTIASFTNAAHNHTNAAGGGQLTDAALSAAVGVAKGGTNLTAALDDNLMVGNGTTWQSKALSDCQDSGGNHLNYNASTNTFTCGSSAGTPGDAAADGTTKGVATFTAADFNATTGVVSLDYTNAQAASSSLKGFLTATDWTTFNGKVAPGRLLNTTPPLTGGGDLSADRTLACPTCTTNAAALAANQLVLGGGSQATATLGSLGTASTVLHGNAAGAPSFGAVALGTEVSGILPRSSGGLNSSSAGTGILRDGTTPTASELSGDATTSGSNAVVVGRVNGVTYAASPATDTTVIITAANTATYKSIPDCDDTGGNHLNYDTTTHNFTCGTSGGGAGTACTPAGATTQVMFNNAGTTAGSSGLTLSTSQVLSRNDRVTAMSADLTITSADGPVIACTTAGTSRVATLPSASTASQGMLRLVKVDSAAGSCTLRRAGSDTMNNAATDLSVSNQNEYLEAHLMSSSNWEVTTKLNTAGGGVPTSRAINTTSPLSGGGDLTADRTIALTGRVPYANIVAPTAASKLLGRGDTTGDWQEITLGSNLSMSGSTLNAAGGGGVADGDKTDITVSSSGATWTIDAGVVTYAKMQNTSAASVLLGRGSASAGAPQELTVGTGLSISGTQLTNTVTATPLATAEETTTGTDATKAVTPDGLATSDYGKRYITTECVADATDLTVVTGACYFPIHTDLAGWNIVGVTARVGAAVSSSGLPTISLDRCGAVATGIRCSGTNVAVLSTNITIDANEDRSENAATAAVINTSNQALSAGQWLRWNVTVTGTGTKGLYTTAVLQKP